MLCCISGCAGRARVIPKSEMANIFADMMLADEWIRQYPDLRQRADTCLFFEAVFNRYGYSVKDYRKSMDEYIEDPEKLNKIYKKASAILTRYKADAEKAAELYEKVREANRIFESGYEPKDFGNRPEVWDTAMWDRRPDTLVTNLVIIKGDN